MIPEPYSMIVCPATPEHPRNGEADMIRLKNGDLLLAYGRWNGGQSDFDTAEIWCKTSSDGGKTWENIRVIDDADGRPWPGFAYTSITPVGDNIILTYWRDEPAGVSLKLKSFDYRWFYEAAKQPNKNLEPTN